jgi:hypothetical protein
LLFRAKHLFFAAMVAIAAAGGSRMSNGTASAVNSEQDLASSGDEEAAQACA